MTKFKSGSWGVKGGDNEQESSDKSEIPESTSVTSSLSIILSILSDKGEVILLVTGIATYIVRGLHFIIQIFNTDECLIHTMRGDAFLSESIFYFL